MPETQFVEPEKIVSRPGLLKNIIKNGRIQSKKEGADGFSQVIWEILDNGVRGTKKGELMTTREFPAVYVMVSFFAYVGLCTYAKGLSANQNSNQDTVNIKPESNAPSVTLREAIELAEQYLRDNHIDTTQRFIHSIELIDGEHTRFWRVLWQWNERVDGPPPSGVYVKMDRTVNPIGYTVFSLRDLQRLPAFRTDSLDTATLQGNLTLSSDGSPVPGMIISLQSGSSARLAGTTDEQGKYRIPRIAPGDCLCTFSLPGFATMFRILHLHQGEVKQLDLKIDLARRVCEDLITPDLVRGKVYINDRIPFPGVIVTVFSSDTTQSVISMEDGEYRFYGLKNGRYNFRFSAVGFEDLNEVWDVGEGNRTTKDVSFVIPWLNEESVTSPKIQKKLYDLGARIKAILAVFKEKYAKGVVDFERREIRSLMALEKIDDYMKHLEDRLYADELFPMFFMGSEESWWLNIAENSGYLYKMLFIHGYDQGIANAILGKKVELKTVWGEFLKEYLKTILEEERKKVEGLVKKRRVKTFLKFLELGLRSDKGISTTVGKGQALLRAACRYGFEYRQIFARGYREGLMQSAGDL